MNVPRLSLSAAEALVRSASGGGAHPEKVARAARPNITISREAGAAGNTVAGEVGRLLGLTVYDKEILEKVADEMGRPSSQLAHVDERPIGWLEEALTALLAHAAVSPDRYLKYLIGTVRGLGEVGGCVLVGRGANRILPPATTLRVRLIADLDDRVRNIQKRLGLGERDARAWVTRTDHERAQFVRGSFGVDVTDPHLYDLVLNTSRVSVGDCVDLVAAQFKHLEARVGARSPV